MVSRVPGPALVSDLAPAIVAGREERVSSAVRYLERVLSSPRGCASWTAATPTFEDPSPTPPEVFSTMVAAQLVLDAGQDSTLVSRALRLVSSSCNPRGFVHFFEDWALLPADIDCTGVGHALLIGAGRAHPDLDGIVDRLLRNVTAAGVLEVYEQPAASRAGRTDATAIVNALYLVFHRGREAEARPSLDYVHHHLTSRAFEQGTRYYPSGDTFLYFLSRLLRDFERAQPRFLRSLHEVLKTRFGTEASVLTRATRVAAADNVGLFDTEDLEVIAAAQRPDGSWPPGAFFKYGRASRYFGSEAVTTAFALRALVAGPRAPVARSWWPAAEVEPLSAAGQVTPSNGRRAPRRSPPA